MPATSASVLESDLDLVLDLGKGPQGVALCGPFAYPGHRVVEVEAVAARLEDQLHPQPELGDRAVQRGVHVGDGTEVAEQQPGRSALTHALERPEGGVEVEVRGRGGRSQVAGLGGPHAGGVPGVEVARQRIEQADMVPRVAGGVERAERAAAAEVDRVAVGQHPDPLGRRRQEVAEQLVEDVAEHHPGAAHEPAGVGEVARAGLVHHDLGRGERGRQRAHAAGVVEVDVRDRDRGEARRRRPRGTRARPRPRTRRSRHRSRPGTGARRG